MSYKDKDRDGHVDLESLEMHVRSSMHGIGSIMLEKLLNADGGTTGALVFHAIMGMYMNLWITAIKTY